MDIQCKNCSARYKIPDEKLGNKSIVLKCKKCGEKIHITPPQKLPIDVKQNQPSLIQKENTIMYKEYKVEHIVESGCGTLLLGAAGLPIKKMEAALNEAAADGWQVVFQVIESKRYLLFWKREAVIITFGR